MSLEQVIEMIGQEVQIEKARCAIAGNSGPIESVLLGTRDGFLNLARILIKFVHDNDRGLNREDESPIPYSDEIQSCLYDLPAFEIPFIVGMEMFESHLQFIEALKNVVDPEVRARFIHDPQFIDPAAL